MAINERQYMAARLAELRDIAKRQKNIENLLEDILEILRINTYGESNIGVQERILLSPENQSCESEETDENK